MNTTRSLARRIHSARFTVVRRSSSMMPTLRVLRGNPNRSSISEKSSTVRLTSSGPCIFGFTIYIEPVREFLSSLLPCRSCSAQKVVKSPSINPSGISSLAALRMAGLVMRWPTLRTNSRLRPGRLSVLPSGAVKQRSGFSRRVSVSPPFLKVSVRSPFIRPSQLRYTTTLSSASTAATESSQS